MAKNGKRGSRRRAQRKQVSPLNKIPMYIPTLKTTHKVRYGSATALNALFTPSSFYFWAASAASSTTAYGLFEGVRIKKLEMWTPPSTAAGVTVSSISTPSQSSGSGPGNSGRGVDATTIGVAECGHLVFVPRKDELLGMWLRDDSTTILCQIQAPAGSCLDVTYETTLMFGDYTISPYTYSTPGVGAFFVPGIRDASSTIQWIPVAPVQTG